MKTKIFITISLLFFVYKSEGQNYKFIYYLDKDLNSTAKENALIIGKGYEDNGTLILNCFLKTTGKMAISASVKDSTLSTLHGLFTTYYEYMKIESQGNYFENNMDGLWKYWDEHGLITDSVFYNRGIRIAYGSYKYQFKKPTPMELALFSDLKDTLRSYRYSFTDSLKNTFTEKEVSIVKGKEKPNFEVDFIGERGLLKDYDSAGAVKTDSVFTRKLQEASFKGGDEAWRNFLRRTLNSLVPANNNAPFGKYTIIIKFVVNPDGTLSDFEAESDPGYGMVTEGIRVLKSSPKWQPQIKYGKIQRANRRQPITFLIEG